MKKIKWLAVGNSFSVDAMEYIYDCAAALGYTDITLGNLYIGGCTLDTHLDCAKNDRPAYSYFKNTDGCWVEHSGATLLYGLRDEMWDVITMQQASGKSGNPDTYGNLGELADYIRANRTNPDAALWWHMTWAYQNGAAHPEFPLYGCDQMNMYRCITECVRDIIITSNIFDGIIPSGTMIQNLRTGSLGDTLTRDGYHISIPVGRYSLAMMWLRMLGGRGIPDADKLPADCGISAELLDEIERAVEYAAVSPFKVNNL